MTTAYSLDALAVAMTRVSTLVMAVLEAGRGDKDRALDIMRVISAAGTDPSPENAEFQDVAAAAAALELMLADFAGRAEVVDNILRTPYNDPRGLALQLRVALEDYERVAGNVAAAAIAWGDEALRGPGLKQECIASLMATGLSRTNAQKEVTAHPRYAEHKEKLDQLLRVKYDAETAATVAKTRLETLQEIGRCLRAGARAEVTDRLMAMGDAMFRRGRARPEAPEPASGGKIAVLLRPVDIQVLNQTAAYFDNVLSIGANQRAAFANWLFYLAGNARDGYTPPDVSPLE